MRTLRRSLISAVLAALLVAGLSIGGAWSASAAPPPMDFRVYYAGQYATTFGAQMGITVLDRDTGQYFMNGHAHTQMRSAQVTGAMLAAALLERSRRGEIALTQRDRDLMRAMVSRSDTAATADLFNRFGGSAMMVTLAAQWGLTEIGGPLTAVAPWNAYRITSFDVVRFYASMLDGRLVPADRDLLLGWMRETPLTAADGTDQYPGLPYALPYQYWGVKQGWSCCDGGTRIGHSTGILGQDNRYVVAVLGQGPQALTHAQMASILNQTARQLFPDGVIPPSNAVRNPMGSLDIAEEYEPGVYEVLGWTADPDAPTDSLDVHVYVDGVLAAYDRADYSRSDVASVLPGYGEWHGYDLLVPVPDGVHQLCVYAINVGQGTRNPVLGCATVEGRLSPMGNFESATAVGLRGMQVGGWAMDLEDVAAATDVVLTVDGVPVVTTPADDSRPDVDMAFPGVGDLHGFSATLGMAWPGRHEVCARAVNEPGTLGRDVVLGCRTVEGPTRMLGSYDAATGGSGTVRVQGWAVDALLPAPPVEVHVYVDGLGTLAASANTSRTDVGVVFPEAGGSHGFDTTFAAAPGPHRVCVYAIYSDRRAANPSLGCRDVVVS